MKNLFLILICFSLFSFSSTKKVKTGFAEVNGTKLYYEVAGKGEPILFVHGNFGDCRHWDYQFKPLSKKYKVIRYDVRGYGKSANPKPNEVYYDTKDIKALMEYLNVDKVHICGLSMGSGIAVEFAMTYPEKCFSLIPIGPWANGYGIGDYVTEGSNNLMSAFVKTIQIANDKGSREATDYWWTGTEFVKSSVRSPAILESLLKMGYEYSYWGLINQNKRSNIIPSAIGRLNEINLPTLIVTAEYDLIPCVEIADIMKREIKGSKLISINGVGHIMNMEKPDEFNSEVIKFIESLK